MANEDDKTAGGSASEVVTLPEDQEQSSALLNSPELDELNATIARLTRERDEARTVARSAYEANTQNSQRLASESEARVAAEETAIDTQIASATSALRMAKAAYSKALEDGEFSKAADLAEEVANARTTLNAAEWQKKNIEVAKERAAKESKTDNTRQEAPTFATREDQFLASISSAESRRWLENHRDVLSKMVNDDRFMSRVAAADNEAYAELGERDTPRYFQFIEERLGMSERRETRETNGTTTAATPRRNSSAGASQAGRTTTLDEVVRKVRQNPSMVAAAKTSFPDLSEEDQLKQYARGIVISKQRDSSYLPDFKL